MATRKPPAKSKAPSKGKGKAAAAKAPKNPSRGSSKVEQGTHYPEAGGSTPPPATKSAKRAPKAPLQRIGKPREDIEHGGSKLVDRDLPNTCTPDEEAFITEYLKNGLNGTAAALRVWPALSPVAAAVKASRLIKVGKIRARIASERQRIAERHEMTREELLGGLVDIYRADPNELVSMRAHACSFCWGGKEGQSTEGDGTPRFLEPDPECASCNGEGYSALHIADTTKLSREGLALYAGMHQTKDGLKVLMHSKLDAAEKIAKIIGAFEADNRQKADALGDLLKSIGRSAFPVVANPDAAQ